MKTKCPFTPCDLMLNRTELRQHERTHYIENPNRYTCEFCEARFGYSNNMKTHILQHSNRRGELEYFPRARAAYKGFHGQKYLTREEWDPSCGQRR
jgi:hypothetical protein